MFAPRSCRRASFSELGWHVVFLILPFIVLGRMEQPESWGFVQVMLSDPQSFHGDLKEKIGKSLTWLERYQEDIPDMLGKLDCGHGTTAAVSKEECDAKRYEFTVFLRMQRRPSRRQIRMARKLLAEGNRNRAIWLPCHIQVTRSRRVFPRLYRPMIKRTNSIPRRVAMDTLKTFFEPALRCWMTLVRTGHSYQLQF